ncbi:MAG TPA: histidine phosphatase family protein [Alphaproteobacteria bacterium]|nr:histidine phosphatase family protein [Alphaproteobacteria bacterium]
MILRISASLAVSCLAAALFVGPAAAGPQGSEPQGVGDVPADSHLPTAVENTDPTPAPEPATEPAPVKKKHAKSAQHHEKAGGEDPSADSTGAASASDKGGVDALAGSALIVGLRQTGYTLVVRHASAPETTPDKAAADPENVNLERQLDANGREQAKMLGVTLRALDVPIGEILSSPAYRAQETVKLAKFGDPVIDPHLDEGGQGMAVQASTGVAPSGNGAWLKSAVANPPRLGTNRLIVTHLPVIVAAFGKNYANVAPDEVLVLKPDGEGDATVVGRLTIDALKKLSGK